MSQIVGILLIPTEAHREALIGDGPCGSRAPVAYWHDGFRAWLVWTYREQGAPSRLALPLVSDGKPVADGLARLIPAMPRVSVDGMALRDWVEASLEEIALLADTAEVLGRGRVILLDADGREVAQ